MAPIPSANADPPRRTNAVFIYPACRYLTAPGGSTIAAIFGSIAIARWSWAA